MLLPTTADLVELVEAVRITEPHGWYQWTDTVPGETVGLWDDAQEVLALVAGLPASTRTRCFSPGFAVRAHTGPGQVFSGQVLFEIAFCFHCHAAWFYGQAVTPNLARQTFDPASAPARELLRRFRESAASR
ncbi:hypothetical protein OG500_37465 [Kitasatospora sp. NBC_01250]|uniref:hypothetical protein n=1 Tax=Kitasatospora sp. NBC_01250 TaxID=2903571 RepID=UPI002E31FF15|nr:hypothetical protein [Kitasatospora sp. NBC_01250]